MNYTFKGSLSGLLCSECIEPLANVTVRLYRNREEQNVPALAAANPKDTFVILTDEMVLAKASSLIAESETDGEGKFVFELGEQQQYNGEAFEVDVYCGTVPHLKVGPHPPRPRQFSITTIQPMWRQMQQGLSSGESAEGALIAAWEYSIPSRFWCQILSLFGTWVICGRVTVCDSQEPVGGVRVRAFDRDWLQDDDLGSAITDGSGNFRIDYVTADFEKTPFSPLINIELIPGPDLYFRVETLGGTALLVEPPSRARQADRENVGNCFCVDLCVSEQQPPDGEAYPAFTNIGGYNFTTDIDSTSAGSGLTIADQRAFYSNMRLNGILSKHLNGNPMEYMFEVAQYDPITGTLGPWSQVTQSQIAPTFIGYNEHFAPTGPGDPNPIKTRRYVVNGTVGPNELVVNFTPDGWIQVPQEGQVFQPQGNFVPNGNMITLISSTLAAFGSIDLTGLQAGNSSTSTGHALAQDRHFAIRMWVREQGSATRVPGGTCQRIAIDNTLYDNLDHHPDWGEYKEPSAPGQPLPLGVAMLDIAQLINAPCSQISNALDVLYTAAHPNLGAVNISMNGPGGPYSFTLAATGTPGDVFGAAIPGFSIASLSPCAYVVHLSVQVLLTTGDSIPDLLTDEIAFCK